MQYAAVVSVVQDVGELPRTYFVSPANSEGEPESLGAYAKINFDIGDARKGCEPVDLIGIAMHRLAGVAQDGKHRHYERALQCLDAAMQHLSEKIEIAEVEDIGHLTHLATERVV